jgi:hypothetical protein
MNVAKKCLHIILISIIIHALFNPQFADYIGSYIKADPLLRGLAVIVCGYCLIKISFWITIQIATGPWTAMFLFFAILYVMIMILAVISIGK